MAARSFSTVHNPHLGGMDGDYLYHLGLTKDDAPAFSDVKFFCTGGSALFRLAPSRRAAHVPKHNLDIY